MSKPLVSVAMAVCNVDHFLAESVEGVLGQTFRDFEFIIVDFGSTDNSKFIVSRYAASESRIKFGEIPHCSLAEARNAACSLAQGKYIARMDADDVSVPDRLGWQVDFMEKHPEVGALGGAVEWIDTEGKPLITRNNPVGNREIQSALLERSPLWQPSVLMRRDAFVGVGGYRSPFAPAEDYDLWLGMAEHFRLGNLRQVVLKYRIHPYQLSMRKRAEQTLCILDAQASASSRRQGKPDPLNSIQEITPAVLARLGVTDAQQQNEQIAELRNWVRNMCTAGGYATALKAAIEMVQCSDWECVERWKIADLYPTISWLQRRQNKYWKSLYTIVRAVKTRPLVLGHPLKRRLRRLRSERCNYPSGGWVSSSPAGAPSRNVVVATDHENQRHIVYP
jgi:hypothetical protein